jgi:FtsH-binding integral membrane protein
MFLAILSFLPLFFWKTQLSLAITFGLTWISFLYIGLFALFAKQTTVLEYWYPSNHLGRLLPWNSETQVLIAIRFIGIVFVGFIVFMAYIILRDGPTAAYNPLGR